MSTVKPEVDEQSSYLSEETIPESWKIITNKIIPKIDSTKMRFNNLSKCFIMLNNFNYLY